MSPATDFPLALRELRPWIPSVLPVDLSSPPAETGVRAALAAAFYAAAEKQFDDSVATRRNMIIKNKNGGDLRLFVVESAQKSEGKRPVVLAVHCGGCLVGIAEMDFPFHKRLAQAGFLVVSPDYRMAPEDKYPAALNDIENTWDFLLDPKNGLGVDTDKMFYYGSSYGSCLGGGMAQRLKRTGAAQPKLTILDSVYADSRASYPCQAADHPHAEKYHAAWSRQNSIDGARYLYPEGLKEIPVEAEVLRSTSTQDFVGLGPHYITAAELDSLADHGPAYYEKLKAAGVSVGLKIFRGVIHATPSLLPKSKTAQEIGAEYVRAYLEVLN